METNSQVISIIRQDTNEVMNFQVYSNYNINNTSTATTYPTTEGTPRTDNIYSNPKSITMSVFISGSEDINDEWGNGENRPKIAQQILSYIKDYVIKLGIETPQGYYTSMYLTAISNNNNTQNSYDFNASLTFTEIFIAGYETEKVGPFTDMQSQANNSNTNNDTSETSLEQAEEAFVLTTGAAALGFAALGPLGGLVAGGIGYLTSLFI